MGNAQGLNSTQSGTREAPEVGSYVVLTCIYFAVTHPRHSASLHRDAALPSRLSPKPQLPCDTAHLSSLRLSPVEVISSMMVLNLSNPLLN